VRRWTVGNRRGGKSGRVLDSPLITIDSETGRGALPLSFANLVELRALREHRQSVPLQAVRAALEFAAREPREPRPLLTVQFAREAGELWRTWAQSRDAGRRACLGRAPTAVSSLSFTPTAPRGRARSRATG